MKFNYGQYTGEPFPSPDSLFPAANVIQFILQHGQDAMDAMDEVSDGDDKQAQYIQSMIDAGLLEKDPETGKLKLTPRMVKGIEHRSMMQIFENLKRGSRESHLTTDAGKSDERVEGTKPYEFGDPVQELDVTTTMRNALSRARAENPDHVTLPLQINQSDFEVHLTQSQGDVATCILLDMSGSMMRWGRFYQAKRVALGMASMIRQRFPMDTVDYAGFYSMATPLKESDLPLLMPKPISTHDHNVRVRAPLSQAMADDSMVPQHFTNLQMGLRVARQMLARRGAANKQIFIITDGQPTAHLEPSASGDGQQMLYLLYPPSPRTAELTLKEALTCQQQGIRIASFALVEDYWGMEWVNFIEQMTRLTRGIAYYCSSDDLSSTIIESYLAGKKRKSAQ